MFRATGVGKIEAHRQFVQAGVLKALLYNFDFDDFSDLKYRELKAAHQNFLDVEVVPLLIDSNANIWMQGSASQIGADSWNMELSQTRVGRVAKFLMTKGISGDQMQLDAIGEQEAKGHILDDELDRSVKLWVYPRFEFHTKPPRKVPQKPQVTQNFQISMVTGLSASQAFQILKLFKVKIGAGIAIEGDVFLIWDYENNIACYYVYVGLGLGFGLNVLPPVSVTTHGPWTKFKTEKPMHVSQFGRWARFTTGGGGNHTVNWITFETPRGIDNIQSLPISTGTTYGAGASTTVGDLIKASHPFHFTGP